MTADEEQASFFVCKSKQASDYWLLASEEMTVSNRLERWPRKSSISTVCPKKVNHLIFDNNVDQFSKLFHQAIRKKFSKYTSQRFPPHLQYVATIPCESQKSKNVAYFFGDSVYFNFQMLTYFYIFKAHCKDWYYIKVRLQYNLFTVSISSQKLNPSLWN